jgi:predicted PurR-regulated permease PerM
VDEEPLSLSLSKANKSEQVSSLAVDGPTTKSIVGSWAWSHWNNVTITFAGKATATAISTAILSYIPYIGAVAGALASVIIAYNYPIGYFKVRGLLL